MSYRDSGTGRFTTREHWVELGADERYNVFTGHRDPATGRFITHEHWYELQEGKVLDETDERGDVGDWDDFEDFDELEEVDYEGE